MKRLFLFTVSVMLLFSFAVVAFGEIDGEDIAVTQPKVGVAGQIKQTKASENAVSLSWGEADGAQGYAVYLLDESTGEFSLAATADSTTAKIGGLSAGNSYTFKVRGFSENADGKTLWGKYSDNFTAVTSPSKVKSVSASDIELDSVTVTWEAAKGATEYRVYVYDKEEEKFVLCGSTVEHSLKMSGLESNTLYTFKVRAVRRDGDFAATGKYSDAFAEFTHKSGKPITNAQAAKLYNTAVNEAKERQKMTVEYTKQIDTGFVSCTNNSLVRTVNNQLNILDGKISQTYKFYGGRSGSVTPASLIEPYSANAAIKSSDIKTFTSKTSKGVFTLKITMKSEKANYNGKKTALPSINKNITSTVQLENIVTKPIKLKKAVQTYTGTQLTIKTEDGVLTELKLHCPVEVNADCEVSTLSFNTVVEYAVDETYIITE